MKKKWIAAASAFVFFLLIPRGESWKVTDAISAPKPKTLKNSLAIVHYEPKCKDFGYWALACHGLFISPSHVLTTRHNLDLKAKYTINGIGATPIVSSKEFDLLIFETFENSAFQDFDMNLYPQRHEKVFIPEVYRQRFFWKEAGRIESAEPDLIILSGFASENGESGKPVFDSGGRLVGIVQGRFLYEKKTIVIPARAIAKCIK